MATARHPHLSLQIDVDINNHMTTAICRLLNVRPLMLRRYFSKQGIPFVVYLLGAVLLGAYQESILKKFGDLAAFFVVVAYLVFLRAVGYCLVRAVEWQARHRIARHNNAIEANKVLKSKN